MISTDHLTVSEFETKPLKITVIGCVEFSEQALKTLVNNQSCSVDLVITKKSSTINSDFVDLGELASQHKIPCVHIEKNDQSKIAESLKRYSSDVVFCVGWSYLLKTEVLSIPRFGVVGYHPAEIPHNRGRHPLIWALALGMKKTASTFFLMDEGADTGRILSQRPIEIRDSDYARDLYNEMLSVALAQIEWLVDHWGEAFHAAAEQPEGGNAWRKRGKQDGKIDWRMSASSIFNLIRALSEPYPGAHFEYDGGEAIVWKAKVVEPSSENLEPGKILAVSGEGVQVKCGEDALLLECVENMPDVRLGDYL